MAESIITLTCIVRSVKQILTGQDTHVSLLHVVWWWVSISIIFFFLFNKSCWGVHLSSSWLYKNFCRRINDVILHLIKGGGHYIQEWQPGILLFPIPEPARHPAFQKSVQRVLKHNENRPRLTPPHVSHKTVYFLLYLSASRWNVMKTRVTNSWGKRHVKSNSGTYPPIMLLVPLCDVLLEATPHTPDGC